MIVPRVPTEFSSELYSCRLMVVDDTTTNRMFIEAILRDQGYTNIFLAGSGEYALEHLESFKPDMIILDVMMPGMDGFECCQHVRNIPLYRDLPILIQTALSEAESRKKAFDMGATDFVSKPIYVDELLARVKVHLMNRLTLKALQNYKHRVESELESARALQYSILPDHQEIKDIQTRCQLQVSSHYLSSSEVGGDFWGIKSIFPHQTALWLVDFSGHGIASALNAFRLQAYLQEYSTLSARPGEYMTQLNDKLLRLLKRGQFATMFYGIIDTQGHQLVYSCAACPHPMILRAASGKAVMIDGTGYPLGVGLFQYETKTVPFYPGDTLMLYSDAFTESPDTNEILLHEQHLQDVLEQAHGNNVIEIRQNILDAFYRHVGELGHADDMTLCICQRQAA